MNSSKQQKYVFLIGTGPWQKTLYNILCSLNLPICTVGPERNFNNTNLHIYSDVRNINAIFERINTLSLAPLLFVSSQTDLTVQTVAELNARFQINDRQISSALKFTDKLKMRQLISYFNGTLHNPIYAPINSNQTGPEILAANPYLTSNIVVKPINLQSSLGVRFIDDLSKFDFSTYFAEMRPLGVDEFILEKAVEGTEYTVEGYKYKNGKHKVMAASRKEKNLSFGVANALYYSKEALQVCKPIQETLNDIFYDYEYGPTHTEVIKTADGLFYLVESAIRGGGSGIPSDIVPALTGFFPERQMIKDSGLNCVLTEEHKRYDYVALIFYEHRTPLAKDVDISFCRVNVIRSWSQYASGDPVRTVCDDRSRHGFLIIGTNSLKEQQLLIASLNTHNKDCDFYV